MPMGVSQKSSKACVLVYTCVTVAQRSLQASTQRDSQTDLGGTALKAKG